MPKIKNISGEDLVVPALGNRLVLSGQVIDVDEADVEGYVCQESTWRLDDIHPNPEPEPLNPEE